MQAAVYKPRAGTSSDRDPYLGIALLAEGVIANSQ